MIKRPARSLRATNRLRSVTHVDGARNDHADSNERSFFAGWSDDKKREYLLRFSELWKMIRILTVPRLLAFGLAAPVAACGSDAKTIGGAWTITTLSTLPEAGAPQHFLNRGKVRVDELVKDWRYFDPDCVVYRTSRMANLVYAVCGARTPVAIASFEMRPWSFDAGGIHLRDEFIPIAAILTEAEMQPAFRDDWTRTAPVKPALIPVKTEVAPTADDLVEVAGKGYLNEVDRLLRAGVSPNAASFGVTPLVAAAEHGHVEVIQRLIAAGANVNFRDKWGMTALDYATRAKQKAAIEALGRPVRP